VWSLISSNLEHQQERVEIAKIFIRHGLKIKEGKIYCGEIEIPASKIAAVADVDRRTVVSTIRMIEDDKRLEEIFANLEPGGSNLTKVAKNLGWTVIEITPDDANRPGILAGVANAVASRGLNIRQAIVDDPQLVPDPKLILVVDGKPPSELLYEVRSVRGVNSVSFY